MFVFCEFVEAACDHPALAGTPPREGNFCSISGNYLASNAMRGVAFRAGLKPAPTKEVLRVARRGGSLFGRV